MEVRTCEEYVLQQLAEKEKEIERLQSELVAKDVIIAMLKSALDNSRKGN